MFSPNLLYDTYLLLQLLQYNLNNQHSYCMRLFNPLYTLFNIRGNSTVFDLHTVSVTKKCNFNVILVLHHPLCSNAFDTSFYCLLNACLCSIDMSQYCMITVMATYQTLVSYFFYNKNLFGKNAQYSSFKLFPRCVPISLFLHSIK